MKIQLTLSALLFMVVLHGFPQRPDWQHTYPCGGFWKELRAVQSTYDNGIIFSTTYLAVSWPLPDRWASMLMKTDINGNTIWRKYFSDPNYTFDIVNLEAEPNGDIIVTGETTQTGETLPMVMKLNACGEKVWCKYLPFDGSYGFNIRKLPGERYLLHTFFASNNWIDEGMQFWFLDSLGTVTYCNQIVPNHDYPFLKFPVIENICPTSDNGFLLTGDVYFPMDTSNLNGWYMLQQMMIKTDSMGNEKWVMPESLDTNRAGALYGSLEFNNRYYAVGSKRDPAYIWGYFRKLNTDGTVVSEGTLFPDSVQSFFAGIKQTEGSLIITGLIVNPQNDSNYTEMLQTDTSGNIVKSLVNMYGRASLFNSTTTARDDKFIIGGVAPYNYANYMQANPWLMKINSNLEYDSVYTFPYVYDSLCAVPIPEQTYEDCTCDLIVGIDEHANKDQDFELEVYPNPASEKVSLKIGSTSLEWGKGSNLMISMVDLYGREMKRLPLKGQVEIIVSDVPAGIYFLSVTQGRKVMARKKLVVIH